MLKRFWKTLGIIIMGLTVATSAQAEPKQSVEYKESVLECSAEAQWVNSENRNRGVHATLLRNLDTLVAEKDKELASDCLIKCGAKKDKCLNAADQMADFCYDGCGDEGFWCELECDIAHGVDIGGCYSSFYACSTGCLLSSSSTSAKAGEFKR